MRTGRDLAFQRPQGHAAQGGARDAPAGRLGVVRVQFRNVRIASQDPGLFEPPADFKRMAVSEAQIETVLKGVEQMQRLRGGGATPAR